VSVLVSGDFRISNSGSQPAPSLGASITLQNPANTITLASNNASSVWTSNLPVPQDGALTNPPTPVIAPARWTFATNGSADLAASSFDFTLPPPIQMIGPAPVEVQRNQDQTISWNPTGLDPAAIATLYLDGDAADGSGRRTVVCAASRETRTLTIPASLLSGFAPGSIGMISVRTVPSGAFLPHTVLKTKTGATLLLLIGYSTSDNRQVDLQ
jgi:hypothetical protein